MGEREIGALLLGVVCALLAYGLGRYLGARKQRNLWQSEMRKADRYARAVDDLDRWCGHTSPHARLIARHLTAHGEGQGYNAGTPAADEACWIGGLRTQLQHLDATRAAASLAPLTPSSKEVG